MRARGVRGLVLAAVATAAWLWIGGSAWAPVSSAAEERATMLAMADDEAGWPSAAVAPAQAEQETTGDGDDRVSVQLWTLVAAVGAAAVGLLLLVVRMAMGWVKPPPPPEEGHH